MTDRADLFLVRFVLAHVALRRPCRLTATHGLPAFIHACLPDGLIVHLSSLLQHFGGKAEIICAPLFLASSSNWTMNKLANRLMVFFFCLKRRLMGEMRARAFVLASR